MELKKYIFNLLLPERCILCGKIITDKMNSYPLCSSCESILIPLKENICSSCGMPLISEINSCLRCRDSKNSYLFNKSLFIYSGKIKELIYQYKFNNRKGLSFYFANMLKNVLLEIFPNITIVPVPGRKIVRKKKGWEHTDLIVQILKNKYKLPVKKLLVREGKKAQKTLSKEKRAENLQKTIKLRRNFKNIPYSIVLLDDVFTTGTTINECSRILKSAGVKEVYSLTIAID